MGRDTDGDGVPDIPLVYDMEEGSRIEFPLNFCPGKEFPLEDNKQQVHVTPDHLTQPCEGQWGIALKEWQVIKQVGLKLVSSAFLNDNIARRIQSQPRTCTDSR